MASPHPDLESLAAVLNARHQPSREEQHHLDQCEVCQSDLHLLRELRDWAELHDPVHLSHPPISDETLLTWVLAETKGKPVPEQASIQACPVCCARLATLRAEWQLWSAEEEIGLSPDTLLETLVSAEALDVETATAPPASLQPPRVWKEKTVWTQNPNLPAQADAGARADAVIDADAGTDMRVKPQPSFRRIMTGLGLVGAALSVLLLLRPDLLLREKGATQPSELTRPRGETTSATSPPGLFRGVVEQSWVGGGVRVLTLEQGMRLGPDDALQLQWHLTSPGTVLLVEQAPSGQRTVLLEQETSGRGLFPMLNGSPAVYTPEQGAGRYVYWMVWRDASAPAWTQASILGQLPETSTLEKQPTLLQEGVRLPGAQALPLLIEVTKR